VPECSVPSMTSTERVVAVRARAWWKRTITSALVREELRRDNMEAPAGGLSNSSTQYASPNAVSCWLVPRGIVCCRHAERAGVEDSVESSADSGVVSVGR